MRQYSGWQALFLSFWSPSFYQDVAKQWKGSGFLYLFLLLVVTWSFIACRWQVLADNLSREVLNPILDQMPEFSIKGGKLTMKNASPYSILNPKTGIAIITFDTRSQPKTLEQGSEYIIVTSNQLLIRSKGRNESIDLIAFGQDIDGDSLAKSGFDKGSIIKMVSTFKTMLVPVVVMFMFSFAFVFCLLQSLLYALIGMLVSRRVMSLHTDLSYGDFVRLAAIALTPVLLIDSLLKVQLVELPNWWLISMVIALAYLFFAIKVNAQPQVLPGTTV